MSESSEPPQIETEVDVMFFDTDCGGVVSNIAYLRFIEVARTELTGKLGMDPGEMMDSQLFPAVVRTEIDYRRPARLGDRLVISAVVEKLESVRFWCGYEIQRPEDETLIATCRQGVALVQLPSGRPKRIPAEWVKKWPEISKSDRN